MRRRIDTFERVTDDTTKPHLAIGTPFDDEPPQVLTLYDDALWAELVEAQERLRAVEAKVSAAAVIEPLDETEFRLGKELLSMLSGQMNWNRWEEIERELVDHAKTIERKP